MSRKRLSGEDGLISDLSALEEHLSRPLPATIDAWSGLEGDILLLGAGGKMGFSLACMAQRATAAAGLRRRIVAVSRFADARVRAKFAAAGIETICGDLLAPDFLQGLPGLENVIYMVGQKFGTSEDATRTWVTNAYLPGLVCRQFASRRMVVFSTGNVYPLVPVDGGGSKETDPLQPVGEYGASALARERICTYFSRTLGTAMVILRLNYATELRYGVLVDLAQKIWRGEPVPLGMGYFNCIWQGDANNMTLRSLAHAASPPRVFNMTMADIVSLRHVCGLLAERMQKKVTYVDSEAPTALLSDSRAAYAFLGAPSVTLEQMLAWTAAWVAAGGETLDKPTHFEVRDGTF